MSLYAIKQNGRPLRLEEDILTPLDVAVRFIVIPVQEPGCPQSVGGLDSGASTQYDNSESTVEQITYLSGAKAG